MRYKKVTVELIVAADEAQEVVAALNSSLDLLGETHAIFGGEIEMAPFEHRGRQKKSALAHTIAAGQTATGALRTARRSVAVALRAVV